MFSLKQLICRHDYEYCGMYYENIYNDYTGDIILYYRIYKLYKCKKCCKLHKDFIEMVIYEENIPDGVISEQQMYAKIYGDESLRA